MNAPPLRVRVNGASRAVQAASLSELLGELGVAHRGGVAVAVNGAVVPRAAWAERRVRDGDEIEIVGAVQGG